MQVLECGHDNWNTVAFRCPPPSEVATTRDTSGTAAFVDANMPPDTAGTSTTYVEPPRALMLARRVLSMDDYVAELRDDKDVVARRLRERLGVRVVPIPVPLLPRETVDEYEERFRCSASGAKTERGVTTTTERVVRIAYARRIAKEYMAVQRPAPSEPQPQPPPQPAARPRERSPSHEAEAKRTRTTPLSLPADVRYTQKVVTLEQFRRNYKSGLVASYKHMTQGEKHELFGLPIVPIFVPLARGETLQQYEDRFVHWLETDNNLTLEVVRADHNKVRERSLRLKFAALNGKGSLRFDPVRFPRCDVDCMEVALDPPTKRRRHDAMCSAGDDPSLESCDACRCDACLVRAIKLYADKVVRLEGANKCVCAKAKAMGPRAIVDLTLDEDGHDHEKRARTATSRVVEPDSDETEAKLLRAYDDINEQIVLNQQALDASVADLQAHPPVELRELTRLHEENEEMRTLLQQEAEKRTAALARLMLYQWRNDRSGLERVLEDKTVSDVDQVQERSHEKCLKLSSELVTLTLRCKDLERRTTTADKTDDLLQELTNARRQRQELNRQRRREMAVLIHFDKRL